MVVRVSVGIMANFTCGAIGSDVDVRWEFEGSRVCDCDSCDGAVCSSQNISNLDPMNNNTSIESVLWIDTARLLIGRDPQQEFDFTCIASQAVPMEVQGSISQLDDRFTATLIVEQMDTGE